MGWGIFREIARPFEQAAHGVGLSGGGVTRSVLRQVNRSAADVGSFAWRGAKNVGAASLSFGTLGLVQPKWSGTKTAVKIGQFGSYAAVAVAGGYALGPYLPTFFAPTAVGVETSEAGLFALEAGAISSAPVVGEQAGAIAALTTAAPEVAPPALSGLELEAAAGSMVPEASTFALPVAAGESSYLLPAAVTGAASATASKLLTRAVDSVINPLFAPSAGRPEGGGGGSGGGSAGGYPFQDAAVAPAGNNAQLYLIAAALAALLYVATQKRRR